MANARPSWYINLTRALNKRILMLRLTIFLARCIGIFAFLLATFFLIHGSPLLESAAASQPDMLVYAIASLALGIAMILGHNIWSGGVLPVAVTVVGWAILAKGLALLFLPPGIWITLLENIHYRDHFYLYLMPSLLIGLYSTWAGFNSQSKRRDI
jgi:hypothetical protein